MTRFVERGGEQTYRPPFLQQQVDLRGFVLQAKRTRLAQMLHAAVDRPSAGVLKTEPIGDRIVLSFARIEHMSSKDPEHAALGSCTETDVTFWVPTWLDGPSGRQLVWWIPYIWVDLPTAVATGREIYGFPKAQADLEYPARPRDPGPYRVITDVLPARTPSARLVRRPLVELLDEGPSALSPLRALGDLAGLVAPSGEASRTLARQLSGGEVPILFLRQLRDVERPERAVFQEWVLATAKTVRIHELARPLARRFRLRVHSTPSHPLDVDLGLGDDRPVDAGFAMNFDFEVGLGTVLHRSTAATTKAKRVAVLGGGMAALSAVWAVLDSDQAKDYEFTVYQRGWRLGGKGASARNLDHAMRIEEHGLHIWFGFYENAFRVLRDIYASLGRPSGAPLASFDEAFTPHDLVILQEQRRRGWVPLWTLPFHRNPGQPGDGEPALTPRDAVRGLWSWVQLLLSQGQTSWLAQLGTGTAAALIQLLRRLPSERLPRLPWIQQVRARLREVLAERMADDDDAFRHLVSFDFCLTHIIGMLEDRVISRGFEVLDDEDYIAWLDRHGAWPLTSSSGPVRAVYDLAFAYLDGDTRTPAAGAGTFLQGVLKLLLCYKGSFMYKMEGGMGDVVFTPFYEALRARGVRFAFFHELENIGLSDDGRRVERLAFAVQAEVQADEYHPLVDLDGLGVWPDRPLIEQLRADEGLIARCEELERAGASEPVERIELRSGEHFDEVILGIPVGAHRRVASELIDAHPRWRAMVEHVRTTSTHAAQLWLRPDLAELGGPRGEGREGPIQGAFAEPTDTWADMTHLNRWERFADAPGHLAYFCGPWPDPGPCFDYAAEHEQVFAHLERFLDGPLQQLWPKAGDAEGRFDRGLLIAAGSGDPLRQQYWRANVDGSDRYVLSVPGSTKHRLRAQDSGVDNLWLAGDWVRTGFSCGCIEAAVISGLQCAAALSGAEIRVDALWEQPGVPASPDLVGPREPGQAGE